MDGDGRDGDHDHAEVEGLVKRDKTRNNDSNLQITQLATRYAVALFVWLLRKRTIFSYSWRTYASCDTDAMLPVVLRAINRLAVYGVKPYRVFVYLLVQDIDSAERRATALRAAGAEVFAQPYRDFTNNIEPTTEQRHFARWVNRKAIFKTVNRFADYAP